MDLPSGDFFRAVIDAAPDGMMIIDAAGVVQLANRRAGELFGLASDALVGSSVDELLPHDVRQAHRAHRLRYRAEPSVRPMGVGMLLRAERADGSIFPVEVSLSPLDGEDGLLVVAAVRDVTARVEAEERMRRVLLTLDASEDAMFIMDAETMRFSYANEGAARQVGYATDELIGMTPMYINPELSEEDWRTAIEPLVDGEQTAANVRTTHRRRDGTDVPVEINLHAAPASQDGQVAIIAVARDISARVEAEEQMRVGERARRDAEQAMAVADDRERIARDLHDTVIQRLFASGLALQAVSTRTPDDVAERIDSVVNDLDQTIREVRAAIFALAAPEAGGTGTRGRILDVVRDAASALGFEPRLQFEGAVETVDHAIVDELLPTLREALSNVAQHASAGVARVVVEVNDEVTLTVTDDGVGAPADVLGGNGLGNMRVRAEQLGGSCVVERREPTGTRVVWSVPDR